MWIDLDIADNEEMIHHDLDLEENATGKERITLSPFDLYNREVGDGNEKDWLTIFAYEIQCVSRNTYMLKKLLGKVSSEDPNFKFTPYGLNSITTPTIIR